MADPTIAVEILDVIGRGVSAAGAVATVMDGRSHGDSRQVAAIDHEGTAGHFNGASVEEIHATLEGKACIASGNVLAARTICKAMIDRFESARDEHLAERLTQALQAGVNDGGEKDPLHSAALLVVHEPAWPLVNLRVDWCEGRPVEILSDLWSRYEPEVDAFVAWAVNPTEA